MPSSLITALRQSRAALDAVTTVEPGEAAVARRLARELDEAIAHLEGGRQEKDLVSIVCHDLKDPLASIVMGAGFLKKAVASSETAALRVVDAISRSADRMAQVVADFHDLAKLETGVLPVELRACEILQVVRGAVSVLDGQARERSIRLDIEATDERVLATCDRARIAQVVSKLVGNALKFTPAGGRVVVGVSADAPGVRVSVRDTGRGIAPERLPTIFDHTANARRAPRDGPGLGLAIARGIVELHGGAISVQSRVGEGSTFAFTLRGA